MHRAVFHAMGAVVPAMRKDLGISATLANAHVSALAIGMMAMGLIAERLAGRFGRRSAIWFGMIGITLGMVLLALAHTVWLTLPIVLIFIGAIGSLVVALTPAALSDHQAGHRSVALAESSVVSGVLGGVVPIAVGLSQRLGYGWGGASLLPVALLIALALRFGRTPVPEPHAPPVQTDATSPIALDRRFWAFFVTLVFTDSFEFGLIFGAAVLLEYRGMSEDGASTALSLLFWGMLVGRIVGSRLVRRYDPLRMLRITFLLAMAGTLVHWLSPSLPISIVGLFLAGIGISNLYPLTTSLGLQAAGINSSQAGSRLSLATGTSMLISPLIFGILTDAFDIRVAFAAEPVFLLIAIAMATCGGRWLRSESLQPAKAFAT
jgi:MFS family permease